MKKKKPKFWSMERIGYDINEARKEGMKNYTNKRGKGEEGTPYIPLGQKLRRVGWNMLFFLTIPLLGLELVGVNGVMIGVVVGFFGLQLLKKSNIY